MLDFIALQSPKRLVTIQNEDILIDIGYRER